MLTGCFNRPPAHGTAFLVEADLSGLPSGGEREQAMASVREVLGKRAKRFGANYSTEPSGTNGVWLKVGISTEPALTDLKKLLVRGGVVEFRLVHPDTHTLMDALETAPGYSLISHKITAAGGRQVSESLLVSTQTVLKGGITSAAVFRGNSGQSEIGFKLNPEARRIFAEVTRANVGRRLAILLDGELQAAPVIQSPIEGGAGQISGSFTPEEAFALASALETPFAVPVKIAVTRSF